MSKFEGMKFREKPIEIVTYPLDLGIHYIAFTFSNYKRESVDKPADIKPENTIALPVPANISESVALSWSDGDTWSVLADDAAGLLAGGSSSAAALDLYKDSLKNTLSDMGNLWDAIKDKSVQVKERTLLTKLPGGFGAAYSSFSGIAVNPNIAIVFKGQAGTREHSFSWKFVPESAEESERLRDVIRELRWQSLPKKQSAHLLEYPNECSISIGGTEAGYLPFYKKCVITAVEVNYTPEGIPTFMRKTGAPAAVVVTITLKETTQLFKNDIEIFDKSAADNKLLDFEESPNSKSNAEKREEG